jgi:hypothetical protein
MRNRFIATIVMFLTLFCANLVSAQVPVFQTPSEVQVRLRAEEIRREKEAKKVAEVLRKKDTPEMRQARKELLAEAKKLARFEKNSAKGNSRAGVSGCDSGTVIVNPKALEFTSFTDSVTVRITNLTSKSRNIETSYKGIGVVVENLCPGGGVSLSFARRVFLSPQYETISLTSTGQGERAFVTENFSMGLIRSYGTNGVQRQNHVWTLRR